MTQTARVITGLVVIAVVTVILGLAYIWIQGGSGAPSATLSAPTLAIATSAPTTAPTTAATEEATTAPTTTRTPTEVATKEATTEATMEATDEATAEATADTLAAATSEAATARLAAATDEATAEATMEATAEATTEADSVPASNLVVFNIASAQSEVRFVLNEILNGSDNEVVGKTDQVAGQIAVDFGNPQASQVGEIRIDVRTLATDSGMRDRMIRGQVLQSAQDEFEFVSFKPAAITGLPATITLGEPISFQITGDLTIRTITKPVTFDVTVTPESEAKISGTASATIQRDDFGLSIPRVPQVAEVDQAVKLEIDFVALPAV